MAESIATAPPYPILSYPIRDYNCVSAILKIIFTFLNIVHYISSSLPVRNDTFMCPAQCFCSECLHPAALLHKKNSAKLSRRIFIVQYKPFLFTFLCLSFFKLFLNSTCFAVCCIIHLSC